MSGVVGSGGAGSGSSQGQGQGQSESADRLLLTEAEVVQVVLEYLSSRKLTGSQLEVEKETGVFNEVILSPDLIFLRSLVLDGRWEDVLEFLQPLEEAFRSFPGRKVRATILKYSFLDKMLSAHHSLASSTEENKARLLEELVKVLNELEGVCESKEEYSSLCLLLTSPTRLAEHPEYKDWRSATARLTAFHSLKPLVQKFIPPPGGPPKAATRVATNDRLIQLLIKGLLYESCVDFCQSKALSENKGNLKGETLRFASLLNETSLSESDLSLISWLRSIPSAVFGCPFQRRNLRVDVEPLPPAAPRLLMNVSIMDSASDLLSRSMASTSFHLSVDGQSETLKTMTTSVDRLFGDMTIDSFHQTLSVEKQILPRSNVSHHLPQHQTTQATPMTFGKPVAPIPPLKPQHLLQSQNQQSSRAQVKQPATYVKQQSIDSRQSSCERDFENGNNEKAKFLAVTLLEDVQAVRCAEFHPGGRVFAIGSNSKTLRLCEYPNLSKITENHVTYQPTILFKRTKHHKGSIYCMGWSPDGNFLATGSNDKSLKLLRFPDVTNPELNGAQETELTMHDGTVRDICFIEEVSNKSSLLVSGGAGDCKIYVTDLSTSTPFQALSGHTGPILSLYNWGGAIFCSGAQDKTIRFWDLRTRGCVDVVTPLTSSSATKSPVASVCVEPSGRLLISGHEDAASVLYDIRGQRQIQSMKSHSADVRSVRFSPASYYLLSAGYDNKLVLTDLQGDLSLPLPSVVVASHQDKVISGRWHPSEFSFLSTSADKTAILWALPPEP